MQVWKEMSGSFIVFLACNLPYMAKDMAATPHAKLADGCYDLVSRSPRAPRLCPDPCGAHPHRQHRY